MRADKWKPETAEATRLTSEEDQLSSQPRRFRWHGQLVDGKTFISLKRWELMLDIHRRRRLGLPPFDKLTDGHATG